MRMRQGPSRNQSDIKELNGNTGAFVFKFGKGKVVMVKSCDCVIDTAIIVCNI